MDQETILALTAIAKSAIESGHAPKDAFSLISGLFNLVAPLRTPPKPQSDLTQRIINAPSNAQQAIQAAPGVLGFIGALPAGE